MRAITAPSALHPQCGIRKRRMRAWVQKSEFWGSDPDSVTCQSDQEIYLFPLCLNSLVRKMQSLAGLVGSKKKKRVYWYLCKLHSQVLLILTKCSFNANCSIIIISLIIGHVIIISQEILLSPEVRNSSSGQTSCLAKTHSFCSYQRGYPVSDGSCVGPSVSIQ